MLERVLCMFFQTLPPPLLAVVLKRWMHVFVVAAFLFFCFLFVCVCVCFQQQQLCFNVQHRKEEKKGHKTILPIK